VTSLQIHASLAPAAQLFIVRMVPRPGKLRNEANKSFIINATTFQVASIARARVERRRNCACQC
jgi:hypothetical protein